VISALSNPHSGTRLLGSEQDFILLSTEDEERSGRPIQVTIPENVDVVHSMILNDQRISAEWTAETFISKK
jgi:hypothetical protein